MISTQKLQIAEIKWIIGLKRLNEMLSFDRTMNLHNESHLSQGIQEWTKQNLWKTAFKNFEVM